MKKNVIFLTLPLLLLTGCNLGETTENKETKEITNRAIHKTVEMEEVSFQIPESYKIEYNSGGALAAIAGDKDPQSGFALFELKVYKQKTSFETFEEFANDLENNLITDLIKANKRGLTDSEIETELQNFEGRYSFEQKTINNFNILLHKRDFFGMIGNLYEMYVFIDKENILHFVSESDHSVLDKIYSSIKKKDQG